MRPCDDFFQIRIDAFVEFHSGDFAGQGERHQHDSSVEVISPSTHAGERASAIHPLICC